MPQNSKPMSFRIADSIVMFFYIQSGRRTFTSIVPLSDLLTAKESRVQKGRDAFASRSFFYAPHHG